MRIFSLAVVLLLFDQCLAQDPVLTPATLTDSVSNMADSNSNIVWSAPPKGKTYQTDTSYDDSGLGPMYDFARSFIGSVFGSFESNADYIVGLIKKKNPVEDPQSIALHFIGFAICIVIGFLFMIIFPIIGCCFCCCRCCGNCGGKMMQKQSPTTSCRRIVYSIILLVLIVFTAVGCACVYVTNEQMSTALDRYDGTFGNNVDDVSLYLDNTVGQIKRILSSDVKFALDVVKRDLDNTGVLVSVPVRDRFDQQLNVKNLFTQVDNLQTDLATVVSQFDTVETDVTTFKSAFSTFEGEINPWIDNYNNSRTTCGGPCSSFPVESILTPTIDTTKIDTGPIRTQVDNIKIKNLTNDVQAARTEFDGIVDRVNSGIASANIIPEIKTNLDSFQSQITPIITEIEKFKSDSAGSLDLSIYKSMVTEYSELAKPYERYRWYAGIGIGSIIALVVLLQFLGLVFGFCGSSASTLPTERGCLSTCGGNMLMASVGFIFIFSSILMFITTLTFTIGAPMEKAGCEPLSQPEKVLPLLDAFDFGNPLEAVFGKGTNITIADIYRDCGAGKSVYDAFKLDQLSTFDLSTITDYKTTLKIQKEIDKITVDFSSLDLTPPALTTSLDDFKAAINAMDFATYNAEISKTVAGDDLTAFVASLNNTIGQLSASTIKDDLETRRDELMSIQAGSYNTTLNAKTKLATSMAALESTVNGIPAKIDSLTSSLVTAETELRTNGSAIVKSVLNDYVARIFRVTDSLVDRAFNSLKNDIAPCTPIYNVYQSLIVVGFCKYFMDAFNGFWFTIGWCIFFFLPSTIFSVKLAKHFRRMKFMDDYDMSTTYTKSNPYQNDEAFHNGLNPNSKEQFISNGQPPAADSLPFKSNKVGHADV